MIRELIFTFFKKLLTQGMSPHKIALTVALGTALALFPVLGVTTFLCALAAVALRLNHAVIQVVNYAVYPLQLALIGGFYALGSRWFGDVGTAEAVAALPTLLRDDFWGGLMAMKQLVFHAVVVWLVISLLLVMVLYPVSLLLASRNQAMLTRRRHEATSSAPPISTPKLTVAEGSLFSKDHRGA